MSKQQFPEPTAGALVFNPEKKILLVKSHKWSDKYTIVGGHIELGEKMENALKRETKRRNRSGYLRYSIYLLSGIYLRQDILEEKALHIFRFCL